MNEEFQGPIVECQELTKNFRFITAVDKISFTVRSGDIFGLIGPNGAGKTTTIRMLATILQPSGGNARICGRSIRNEKEWVRSRIGYMPDYSGFYQDLKVEEYLGFFAAAYNIPSAKRSQAVSDILALIDLTARRHSIVRTLSRGMRQRLDLGRALINDPALLLLDEPASGLDPAGRVELRALLKELQRMGKTIVISSHILPELEQLCNKLAIIADGKAAFSGTIEELRSRMGHERRLKLKVESPGEAAMALSPIEGISDAEVNDASISFTYRSTDADLNPLLNFMIAAGVKVKGLDEEELSLEEMYLKMIREESGGGDNQESSEQITKE